MAQSIGSKIRGIFAGVLIGLLVLAFAVWGVNDMFTPKSTTAVVKLGDSDITARDFNQAFKRELANRAVTDGRQMPHQEAYDRGVHAQVLSRLISDKIIELDALDLGIGVNRQAAEAYVEEVDGFKDELTGKFSEKVMVSTLAMQRPPISRGEFEKMLVLDLRRQQTLPAITGGIVAPVEFAEERYQYLTEQRRATVLTIDEQAVPAAPEPTDEELKDYIKNNVTSYIAPPYRSVTLVRLEKDDVRPDIDVTEEELKAHYEYKLDLGELGSPAKRSLVQLTANDEETAKKAAERLKNGEDPETIANLLTLPEPSIYTDVEEAQVTDPETGKKAFAMQKGDVDTVLGSLGLYYAIIVTGVTESERPDFEALRAELTTSLEDDKAEQLIYDITEKFENAMVEGMTIEEAADIAEIPYVTIDYIDRTGTTQDGKKLSEDNGVANDEKILTEIFINEVGYETDPFETSGGGWAVLRVEDVIESKEREFEDVKDTATRRWKSEKVSDALDALAIELEGKAISGESLSDIAKTIENGAALEDVILLRSQLSPAVGPLVTVGLLDGQVDTIARGPGPKPMTRQIGKLNEIIANSDGLAGSLADRFQDEVTAAVRADILDAYYQAVLKEYPQIDFPDNIRSTLGLKTSAE